MLFRSKLIADGITSFYVHTIVGPRISAADTTAILKAFVASKTKLGVASIVLPIKEHVNNMVNVIPVREVLHNASSPDVVKFQYQDQPIRSSLKTTFSITKTYDDAEKNLEGHKLNEQALGVKAIQVGFAEAPSFEDIDSRVEKNSFSLMLVQMAKDANNKAMLEALAKIVGVSADSIHILAAESVNVNKQPAEQFVSSFEELVRSKGIEIKDGYFQKNIDLLAEGLSNAPDITADLRSEEHTSELQSH